MPAKAQPKPASAATELAALIAKFEPAIRKKFKAVRAALRKRFPTANELVYEYASSLVISYSPSEHGIQGVVGISATAEDVRLYITHANRLPDPHGILQGKGSQARYVELAKPTDLKRPEIEALVAAAVKLAKPPLGKTGGGQLIIKATAANKRATGGADRRKKAAR